MILIEVYRRCFERETFYDHLVYVGDNRSAAQEAYEAIRLRNNEIKVWNETTFSQSVSNPVSPVSRVPRAPGRDVPERRLAA